MIYILTKETEEDYHQTAIDFLWASTNKEVIITKYNEYISKVAHCHHVKDECWDEFKKLVAKKGSSFAVLDSEYKATFKPYHDLDNEGYDTYGQEYQYRITSFSAEDGQFDDITDQIIQGAKPCQR